MKPKPFSNNIIFFDAEFSTLDPLLGELLSVGLVKVTGEELYLELEYEGEYSGWVKKNILKDLNGRKYTRKQAISKIKTFVGKTKPYMVSYVNQFDTIFMHKLFGVNKWPMHWLPVDFASMLFALGIDPESMVKDDKTFYQRFAIDRKKYHKHNALEDARLLKETYEKVISR